MILIVDNYDSFTYNLVHAVAATGASPLVVRNDAMTRSDIERMEPEAIILSPGPGSPANERDFGVCKDLIVDPLPVPMLGVCLGMQGMALHTGGKVIQAPEIVHGEASPVTLAPHPVFAGIAPETLVGRYHSLAVDPDCLPDAWNVLARAPDGTLMAIAHKERPWIGVQFHPESILTPEGSKMIQNFLEVDA